jgi:hypothetical protein
LIIVASRSALVPWRSESLRLVRPDLAAPNQPFPLRLALLLKRAHAFVGVFGLQRGHRRRQAQRLAPIPAYGGDRSPDLLRLHRAVVGLHVLDADDERRDACTTCRSSWLSRLKWLVVLAGAASAAPTLPPMERAVVEPGVELEYRIQGIGEPVVLLHAGLFADWFQPLLDEPALVARHRVVNLHRIGYAGSSRVAGPVSIARQAAQVRALLQRLGIDRAHIVGHSSGGNIALQLALDAPQLVRSLALLRTGVAGGRPGRPHAVDPTGCDGADRAELAQRRQGHRGRRLHAHGVGADLSCTLRPRAAGRLRARRGRRGDIL